MYLQKKLRYVTLSLAAALSVQCNGNGVSEDGPNVEIAFPSDISGTWGELGPELRLRLAFAEPETAFDRFVSFTVDGEEYVGSDVLDVDASEMGLVVNAVLVLSEIDVGLHEVATVVSNRGGQRSSIAWEFEVLDESTVTYVSPDEEAEYLREVRPAPGAVGSWEELGGVISVRIASSSGLGSIFSLTLDGEELRDVLSQNCTGLELSQTCSVQLDDVSEGHHVVRFAFSRPPDVKVIRRVEWAFDVIE